MSGERRMQGSSSGGKMLRTISKAAGQLRDGLNDYLGIDPNEASNESYYVNRQEGDQPYWMQDNFWNEEQQQMQSVAVVPNGYEEPPPPYVDAPPVYAGNNQYYTVGVAEMRPMGSPQQHIVPVDSYEKTLQSPSPSSSRGKPRGRGRGRGRDRSGRGRGRGGRADSDKKQVARRPAPPPTYKPFFIMSTTIIDLILLIWEIILNGGFEPWSQNPWFGPSATILLEAGAKYSPLIRAGEGWRFVTPIFLHVGVGHFVLNMLTQLRVGVSLEKTYGAHRIVPIYMICGVFGNLMSAVVLPNSVQVGASGALFGFTGVLFADLLQNWSLIENPVRNLFSLLFSTAISFVMGLVLPGVDNFAHLGGLIMGVLTGFIFLPSLNPARGVKKGRLFTVMFSFIIMVVIFIAMFTIYYKEISTDEWCYGCHYITCIRSLSWCATTNS